MDHLPRLLTLVESGQMSATRFHDAIMLGGRLPVELVRVRLAGQPLTRDYRSQWRFDGPQDQELK